MYTKQCRFLLFLVVILHFASCIVPKQLNYLQNSDKMICLNSDSNYLQDYRLRVGNKLHITVYSTHKETNELLNGGFNYTPEMGTIGLSAFSDLYTYTIATDGTITFPLTGKIKLKGLTVREASREMEKALRPYLKTPGGDGMDSGRVDVRLLGRYFSVLGDVGRTGHYPILNDKMTIFQALAMAGDMKLTGDRRKIRIIRESEDGARVLLFDIRSEAIVGTEFYYIQPNDVIYVQSMDERFFKSTGFTSLLSTLFSTLSLGTFLYSAFIVKPLASN